MLIAYIYRCLLHHKSMQMTVKLSRLFFHNGFVFYISGFSLITFISIKVKAGLVFTVNQLHNYFILVICYSINSRVMKYILKMVKTPP